MFSVGVGKCVLPREDHPGSRRFLPQKVPTLPSTPTLHSGSGGLGVSDVGGGSFYLGPHFPPGHQVPLCRVWREGRREVPSSMAGGHGGAREAAAPES